MGYNSAALNERNGPGMQKVDRSGKSLQIRCVEVGQGEAIWDKGVLKWECTAVKKALNE